MKKLLFLVTLQIALAGSLFAQNSTPRFGSPPNGDNTGRTLPYAFKVQTYAAALQQFPNAFETIYKINLTGALTDSIKVDNANIGDRVIIIFTGDTTRVVTFTQRAHSTGTLSVANTKRAVIEFVFDGTYWLETNRSIGL